MLQVRPSVILCTIKRSSPRHLIRQPMRESHMSAFRHAVFVPRPRPLHRARRRVVLALLLIASWLAMPVTAKAHGALKRSTPKAGALLDTIPRELRLEFSEQLDLRLTKFVLAGPGGGSVTLGALVFGDNTSAQITAETPVLTGSVAAGYTGTVTIGVPLS